MGELQNKFMSIDSIMRKGYSLAANLVAKRANILFRTK